MSLALTVHTEELPLRTPLVISRGTIGVCSALVVELRDGDFVGRGEAQGIPYQGETLAGMAAEVEAVRGDIERGIDRQRLRQLLPRGGARNAVDCALWDLEAKRGGSTVWAATGIVPKPVETAFTVGIGEPEAMAAFARAHGEFRVLKIKLDARDPVARVRAVRAARPDAMLVVDANQAWDLSQLMEIAPAFAALGVAMIEQPLPRGADAGLECYTSPVPLCADESCQGEEELDALARRYSMINIKLDKSGGLTESLELARAARQRGLGLMVGNMLGTSLAMAPAFVVAQACDVCDLDGPTYLKADRAAALSIEDGWVSVPTPELWG